MSLMSHISPMSPISPIGPISPIKRKKMTIEERQDVIIEEFTELEDWMDRYQLLIDMGSGMEPLAEEYKTEQNLIDGCQSRRTSSTPTSTSSTASACANTSLPPAPTALWQW